MTPNEYESVRDALGWTHAQLAETIGVSERTPYRFQSGDVKIQGPEARLLRLLMLLRLTMSARKFNALVEEICK